MLASAADSASYLQRCINWFSSLSQQLHIEDERGLHACSHSHHDLISLIMTAVMSHQGSLSPAPYGTGLTIHALQIHPWEVRSGDTTMMTHLWRDDSTGAPVAIR